MITNTFTCKLLKIINSEAYFQFLSYIIFSHRKLINYFYILFEDIFHDLLNE